MLWILAAALAVAGPGRAAPLRGTLKTLGETTRVEHLDQQYAELVQAELKDGDVDRAEYAKLRSAGWMEVFKNLVAKGIQNRVLSVGVQYHSEAGGRQPRVYSGRVYLPFHDPAKPPLVVPLVLYQHATETQRTCVPSLKQGEESILGALAARACGFAVAMPDGDGMGQDDPRNRHAYCSASTTSACALDMVRAVLGPCGSRAIFDGRNYLWDGRLFIMGYSEGGYIALASVRELAGNPEYQDLELTGAACMGGPFDLVDTISGLLHSDQPYATPYIAAYFVATWEKLLPREVAMASAINPRLLAQGRPPRNIVAWLDGSNRGSQITPWIQERLRGNPNTPVPAKEVLNPSWIKRNLDDPRSALMQALTANTLAGPKVKPWAPPALAGQKPVPVLLMHDRYDETVNASGSTAIYQSWVKQGIDPIGLVEMNILGQGTGHAGGAIVAIPFAFMWIDAGMPRDFKSWAQDKVAKAIRDHAPRPLQGNAQAWARALAGSGRPDDPEFRLSKLVTGASGCRVSYLAAGRKVGKVKFYTLQNQPAYPGQVENYQVLRFTRLVKELKFADGKSTQPETLTCDLPPHSVTYLAVYPSLAQVDLTLRLEGPGTRLDLRFQQTLKNKFFGRQRPVQLGLSGDPAAKARVVPARFEEAGRSTPFITLP